MNKIVWDIVSRTISSLNEDDFQAFCTEILPCFNSRYEGIERHGATASRNTRKGTPDSIKTDSEGNQIAMQASIDKNYWNKTDIKTSKPYKDIIKCKNNLTNLQEIILMSNQEIPTNNADIKSQIIQKFREEDDKYIQITFFSLATIEGFINRDFLKCYTILKKYMILTDISYIEKDFPEETFLVKQYICDDWEIIPQILKGNLRHFPCKSEIPILYSNSEISEIIKIALKHVNNPLSSEEEHFSSIKEIQEKHSILDISKCTNEYTGELEDYITRPLELKDLNPHYIQKQLVLNGFDIKDIGIVEYPLYRCGDDYYGNHLNIIRPKFSFLYIQNISKESQTIKNLDVSINNTAFQLKQIKTLSDQFQTIPFREMQIEPNQAIIIPQGFLFWENQSYDSITTQSKQLVNMGEHGIEEIYTINENKPEGSILTPFFIVTAFEYIKNSEIRKFEVKAFDINNYFKINHCWYCGSCPHFYVQNCNNTWKYIGETLTNIKLSNYTYKFIKPLKRIKIAELEEEISYINNIDITDSNSKKVYDKKDIILNKNEFLDINLEKISFPITIEIEGFYRELFANEVNNSILDYKQRKAREFEDILNQSLQVISN